MKAKKAAVWAGAVPLYEGRGAKVREEAMKLKTKTAKAVGMVGFLGAYKVFCTAFDPTGAFLLALIALAAVRHI